MQAWRWLAAGALLAALAAGCSAPSPKPAKTVEVVVTTPIVGEVMDYQDFTGRLDAFRTVEVRARVTGYVNEAYFTEGELVPEGKVLFLIDPRPYKTDLAQAEANLKLALADRSLQELNTSDNSCSPRETALGHTSARAEDLAATRGYRFRFICSQ